MTPDPIETETHPAAPATQTLDWHAGDMPYSREFDDHFFCRTDGRLECGHVFLSGNRLPERWAEGGDFAIGELGFGTGLNFCETWRQWTALRRAAPRTGILSFTSFERFPMKPADIARALSPWPEIEAERAALLALWPASPEGHVVLELAADVRLTVLCGTAVDSLSRFEGAMDAWFLDGFAPARNPDMWSAELMAAVHDHTRPGGTFATYAAAGFVRRNLQAAGFAVERRPGFAGKREMLCGLRQG